MFWIILIIVLAAIIIAITKSHPKEDFTSNKFININTTGKDSLVFELAGVHINKEFIMNFCKKGDIVTLEYEPSNTFDKDAIKVMHGKNKIGYVPSIEIQEIREFMMKYNYISFIYVKESYNGFISVEIGLVEN